MDFKKINIFSLVLIILVIFALAVFLLGDSLQEILEDIRCGSLEDNSMKLGCYIKLAISTNNPDFCDKIEAGSGTVNLKGYCYSAYAFEKWDAEICKRIQLNDSKALCTNRITPILVKPFLENQSQGYIQAIRSVARCNADVITRNMSDYCFPYREIVHNACRYYLAQACMGFDSDYLIEKYNLTHSEIRDICYRFAHKGLAAYCLHKSAINESEEKECMDLAAGNGYLEDICNLKEGEVFDSDIPSKTYSDLK